MHPVLLAFCTDQRRFNRFKEFHAANPQVFGLFKHFAYMARGEGVERKREQFGARMLGERIRWYTTVETTDPDFKICNNHWPYYSRLLMLKYPADFAEFFQRKDKHFDVCDEQLLRECG